ncbi:MAG: CoA transferase [Myxococcaceae bacterium]|nr:CoA transferase [Myxococcaceae bacterium]
MSLPLTGLKVLDLSRLLPGPYATLVLADLGAAVDKLEEPQGGDYTRHMPPMKDDTSALFLGLNRNKRSFTLDLKSPDGVAALKRLVKHYDVLVESFRPGVMDKLGVGYEALSQEHPALIFCSISGYGATGPDRLKAGHDLNYIGRSGVLAYGGVKGGAPAMPGVQIADIGGGSLFALVGVLAALHERQRTGRGRFVDISMTEGSMAFLHMHLAARLMMGSESGPLTRGVETLNGGYACYGVYRTQDGRYLAVGSLEPKFFSGLCAVLERPDLMPGGYDTGEEGARTRRELEAIFASRPQAHWVALFKQHDLCVEPVNEGDEVLSDPQLVARGMFVKAGDVMHLKTPLHFGPMPTRPSPGLGEHTSDVLRDAGFSEAEIAALSR